MTTNNPIYSEAKWERIDSWLTRCPHKIQLASVLADYEQWYRLLYAENKKLKEDYQRLYEEFDMYVDENGEAVLGSAERRQLQSCLFFAS